MRLAPTHACGAGAGQRVARGVSMALAILSPIALATGTAHARTAASHASLTSEVALLTQPQELLSPEGEPLDESDAVSARRPITGVRTALPVIGRTVTPEGVELLHVLLPGRPNGSRGWIAQAGTTLTTTSWRIVVRTTSRRLLIYHHGRLERTLIAIVGKPSTPTPHGYFFVEESVRMPPGSTGGAYALALSAHSNVLQEFEGGHGQIAIHGLARLTGRLGTASSHGCIRLDDQSIRWLAAHIAPGVPVRITR
jgi:lipoprotein-anchoring transpeptidase ErfK/SrfK